MSVEGWKAGGQDSRWHIVSVSLLLRVVNTIAKYAKLGEKRLLQFTSLRMATLSRMLALYPLDHLLNSFVSVLKVTSMQGLMLWYPVAVVALTHEVAA